MESECPTPYNSLYVPVKKCDVVCCMHGTSCEVGKEKQREESDDNLSEQYVNLVDTKRGKETNRDELIQSLAGKLREFKDVNVKRKQRRSSKHRKSSKESRIEEDVSSRRTDDGSSTRERDESSRRRKEDAGMRKYDDEESSDFETAVRTADRRRRREGMWDSSTRDRRSKSVSKSSTSGSKNLVRDLDVSEDSKPRRRRERRERRRRGNRENKESQIEKSGMFESIQNIMPSDDDQKVGSNREKELSHHNLISAKSPQQLEGLAKSVYIGVCNFAKAEEQVEKRADFRVYHQLVHRPLLDDLEQELPLIVVYKTANGSFRHYPIRRRKVGTIYYYYVDYGDPKVPAHASLDHLVRFYQINAQRHPEHRDYADQFPWWEVHL